MMERTQLSTILSGAAGDPVAALARLWWALHSDRPFFEAAVGAAMEDLGKHKSLSEKIFNALWPSQSLLQLVPPSIGPEDALAALVALDGVAAQESSGSKFYVRRVKGNGIDVWVQRRPVGCSPRFQRQPNQLQYWARGHWVLPAYHLGIEICVSMQRDEGTIAYDLSYVVRAGELRVHVGGFDDGVRPARSSGPPNFFPALDDPEKRWLSVVQVLEKASGCQAHVVVFPELTIPPVLRERIAKWLAREKHPFLLVVPGAFHTEVNGTPRSVAVALDKYGDAVLVQEKILPTRVVGSSDANGLAVSEGDRIEGIRGGSTVRLIATPLGLLAIGICLDFCDEGPPLGELWRSIGPGLAMVPSMGNGATETAHERRATSLFRQHQTITAAAIQPTEGGFRYGFVLGRDINRSDVNIHWISADGEGVAAPHGCVSVSVGE